jgi:hypothetical protein
MGETSQVTRCARLSSFLTHICCPSLFRPMNAVYYPIIDAVDSIRIDVDEDQPVVGVLTFILYWRELINHILPANSNGVIVVIENACDQVFTYQLNGPDTVYLGSGDQHDPKYDYLERTASLFDLMDSSKLDRKSSYTGIPGKSSRAGFWIMSTKGYSPGRPFLLAHDSD